ncbi:hypothetical protein D1BOALGB6SA_5520 [Olavius sp. associated proteobacterium Delta 1]|nr:hypothetical protein D1BOALGB6SA_5520 [Olavius sp. associated proteobacterium Delta 1]
MVERWHIGFQKRISPFNFIVNPAGDLTNNLTSDYSRTHQSTIPTFQYSNGGEAPNLRAWHCGSRSAAVLL